MAHFIYVYPVPVLPAYGFLADLSTNIIPPQDFVGVPGISGQVYLRWTKHVNTADPLNNLYTEIYRSTDLATWNLLATRQWLLYSDYTDVDVKVGYTYYYRLRFVRRDVDAVVSHFSDYTPVYGARVVSALGFEPRDEYSNRFLYELLNNLPGTRIYDRTTAATFSADEQLWQTTCRITDSFRLTVDGSVAHEEPTDAQTTYQKRLVSFIMDNKHVVIQGQNAVDGTTGEQQPVSAYLIHTFLQSYAQQFKTLNDTYLQIVANKYVDAPQIYALGFYPVVANVKTSPVSELYASFGQFMRLEPLKAQQINQGLIHYRQTLRDSFTNVESVGEVQAINQACADVLGITTQNIREYNKIHWFKSDRETKLYKAPDAAEVWNLTTNFAPLGCNISFTLIDRRYTVYVEYVLDATSVAEMQIIGGLTPGPGPSDVANPDNPYTYLFRVHLVPYNAHAYDVKLLFDADPIASTMLTAEYVSGSGGDYITQPMPATLIGCKSLWIGWENHNINMYGRKFLLQDTTDTLTSDVAYANESFTLSKIDPDLNLPSTLISGDYPNDPDITTSKLFTIIPSEKLIISERDDVSEGVSFGVEIGSPYTDYVLYGDKRACFTLDLPTGTPTVNPPSPATVSDMQWVTRAILKLYVYCNTSAGYIKLYRLRKSRDAAIACWNRRDTTNVPSGSWEWDGSAYVSVTAPAGDTWTTECWETSGASGLSDARFLTEFYIPRITTDAPQWVSVDITSVIQDIYKYEASNLDMANDPENILFTGFMLTSEGFTNRSMTILASSDDATYKPKLEWSKLVHGLYQCPTNTTTYFYIDGTTRYGRMLVQQSATEPISYIRTVNELIRSQDIIKDANVTLTLSGPATMAVGDRVYGETTGACATVTTTYTTLTLATSPVSTMMVGARVYGQTSGAYGTISVIAGSILTVLKEYGNFSDGESIRTTSPSLGTLVTITTAVNSPVLTVQMEIRNFSTSESVRLLTPYAPATLTIDDIAYIGNMSVRLSRMPVSSSSITVYHTTSPAAAEVPYPAEYPAYTPWTEVGAGIAPIFVTSPAGSVNIMATRNETEPDIINLNVTDDVSKGGVPLTNDVIVTYQYLYDMVSFGRAVTTTDNITDIDGCNRVASGLFIQRESDAQYKCDLMLPQEPALNAFPDIAGDATTDEYSDHNLGVLCQAVHNIRRQDGPVDVFKYQVAGKPYYIPGQNYHQFFERV